MNWNTTGTRKQTLKDLLHLRIFTLTSTDSLKVCVLRWMKFHVFVYVPLHFVVPNDDIRRAKYKTIRQYLTLRTDVTVSVPLFNTGCLCLYLLHCEHFLRCSPGLGTGYLRGNQRNCNRAEATKNSFTWAKTGNRNAACFLLEQVLISGEMNYWTCLTQHTLKNNMVTLKKSKVVICISHSSSYGEKLRWLF